MTHHSPSLRTPGRLAHVARAILAERQRRGRLFDPTLFGEPAWDILLALYAGEEESGRQTIGQLIRWVDIPQTTALRWIAHLERRGLLVRRAHPTDMRITFVELAEPARARLAEFLAGVDIDA